MSSFPSGCKIAALTSPFVVFTALPESVAQAQERSSRKTDRAAADWRAGNANVCTSTATVLDSFAHTARMSPSMLVRFPDKLLQYRCRSWDGKRSDNAHSLA